MSLRPGEVGFRGLAIAGMFVICAFVTVDAFACPVCFGSPDDPMVKGVNNAIWVLLGFVGFVQLGFVALFWSFWRRAREQQQRPEGLRVIEGGPQS